MRTILLTTLLITGVMFSALAQYNVVVFAEQGEKFFLVLNGVRQNDEAQTNVKVTDLVNPMYKAKIIFEDANLGEFDKNLLMPEFPAEVTYNLKTNKKGEYVVRYQSAVPLAQAPPPAPQQQVVVFNPNPAPVPAANVTVTEQTTTTTVVGGTRNNVGVGMSVPGASVNMNINVDGMGMGMGGNVAVSETYTTTTTTTTTNAAPAQPDHYVMPGYNGPIGCPWPMDDNSFSNALNTINNQNFEDDKLTTAIQVANSNCLTSRQVTSIMQTFNFEDSRLEFAKGAYGRTYDIGNYFMVNDVFNFSSSVDELNAFINGGGGGW